MVTVNARGKSCPMPIVLMAKALRAIEVGERVVVQADDRAFPHDVEAWCRKTGNALISLDSRVGYFEAQIQRER